jgi:hypothetical protein
MPMPMSEPEPWSDKPLDWIKPRRLDPMPRCLFCKSPAPVFEGTYQPGAMFHPAHTHGPCLVRDEGQRVRAFLPAPEGADVHASAATGGAPGQPEAQVLEDAGDGTGTP